jgi:predicted alpha/beta hydrolase family esterase
VKRHVLFVHGAGEGAHEADERLAASLREALGSGYDVRSPRTPDEDSPEVGAWKEKIAGELATMNGEVILVGHSVGAFVLLEYLSEEEPEKPVAGLFLVSTPYVGTGGWEMDEYASREDPASGLPEGLPMFFYHGREDEVVPFEHLALYAQRFPRATFRAFDGRGHQLDDDLSEVARDVEASQEDGLPPDLAGPARRALLGAGYRRLGQLAGLRESEVGILHGMGPKALGQLRRALGARGLSFAGGETRGRGAEGGRLRERET